MAEVTLTVAGRSYRIGCEDGEEAHVEALGRMLDGEAQKLAGSVGPTSEGRLLLMTALMVADRLADAEKEKAAAEKKRAEAEAEAKAEARREGGDPRADERELQLTEQVTALAIRLEKLAERVGG